MSIELDIPGLDVYARRRRRCDGLDGKDGTSTMSAEFFWQIPTIGDGRYGAARVRLRGERSSVGHPYSEGVSDPRGRAFNYFDYLHQVARAADLAGFDGIRIPEDPRGDEPWIVAGYVAQASRRLKLLTEFEASRGSAVYAAKNAVTFQRYTGERFAWQIRVGASERERATQGDHVPQLDLLARIEEFVTVARGVIEKHPYDFEGRFFEVAAGGFQGPLANHKVPPVYLSGGDDASLELSARSADVHVFEATRVADLSARVERLRSFERAGGRRVGVGIRIDVIARESEKEAIFDARRFWDQSGGKWGEGAPVVSTNLWSGLSTSSTGASATLVGSYAQVARALDEYGEAGVESFLLSAVPHFEEAYRLGEHVLPVVASRAQHRRVA
jgi:alkanesulfonate monooxygenase